MLNDLSANRGGPKHSERDGLIEHDNHLSGNPFFEHDGLIEHPNDLSSKGIELQAKAKTVEFTTKVSELEDSAIRLQTTVAQLGGQLKESELLAQESAREVENAKEKLTHREGQLRSAMRIIAGTKDQI